MNLKDRKFIPYYIAGALIILVSVLTVVFIGISNGGSEVPEEVITEPPTLFMDGKVPYYPDIPASAYPQESFRMTDDGRIEYTDASVTYTTGIDVSSHQGIIDWEAVKEDGIDFAIVRIGYRGYGSEGNVCEDDVAELNLKGAADAGLKVGAYFFSQAVNAEEAIEEADFVLNIIRHYDIDYPVVFDWENEPGVGMRTDSVTGQEMTECAAAFCERIKDAGYVPAVYFNLSDAYINYDLDGIKTYPFWYAQHENEAPSFYYNYCIWQYSDTGKVDGINGNVDLNISFSDFSEYK